MKRIALLLTLIAMADPAMASPLSDYTNFSTFSIEESVSEASGITYNRVTNTLFSIGDEGQALVQLSKTGQFINSMGFDFNTSPREARALDDPEGVTYMGNNTFMIADERDFVGRVTTYQPGATLTLPDLAPTSYAFGPLSDNQGLEGVAYDPINNSIWGVKEKGPLSIYEMSNLAGGGTVTTPFHSRFLNNSGITDIADIYMLASSAAFALDDPRRLNLLILSQESGVILEMTRAGEVVDSLDISFIGSHSIEGITMDDDGVLYLVGENSGVGDVGSALYVVSAVPEPSTYALLAIGALGLWAFYHRQRSRPTETKVSLL